MARRLAPWWLVSLLTLLAGYTHAQPPLNRLTLPAGFRIGYFVSDIPDAREMALGPPGVIFVGSREAGRVYAVMYHQGSHHADRVITIAHGLDMPNGVAYHKGALYVAEMTRLLRYDHIADHLNHPPRPVVLTTFPSQPIHGWKFIAFGPDGKLYVPIGAPCNVCIPPAAIYATIQRMNADGSGRETFARGVRNTVGFDWQPGTKELWFTDNGRDRLSDNLPPDELNCAPRAGLNFGFPYCFGKNVPDPQWNRGHDCADFTPAVVDLGPHVAPLGMRFYTGSMFPRHYHDGLFIAEHGSWDRSVPIGYRVVYIPFANGRPAGQEVFARGWLQAGRHWGRPVDVLVMPDGALLVSDDYSGAIYRVSYVE